MQSIHQSPLRLLFTFLVLAVCFNTLVAQQKSTKRGLAYGSLTEKDLKALQPGVSWWYNWSHQPEPYVINTYQNYGFEFVPMAWNGGYNKTALKTYLAGHPDARYILGWNEPNFITQANMTPSQAAAGWKDLEAIADSFNLKIVGPAVNYCDKCVVEGDTITDPVAYLDSFFIKCPGCRVDYIAVHNYMGNVSALQWYIGLFKKYGKPIWLTEFASWESTPTVAMEKSYLIGAVDYLESDTAVFRYAWFTGRSTQAPAISLLSSSGVLTDLGKTYITMPVHDTSVYTPVPARIEAETYSSMKGILLEATSDTSGFANVGYIDANDWLEYNLDVPCDTTFQLEIRYAGTSTGSLDLLVNGNRVSNQSLASTGGWQNWKSLKSTLDLKSGKNKLRLLAKRSGFNLNWFRLYYSSSNLAGETGRSSLRVFPNPAFSKIRIEGMEASDRCEFYDLPGHRLNLQVSGNEVDLSSLAPGIILLRVARRDGSVQSLVVRKVQDAE
ncbi:MAG: glycosyl hydrolase [Bacteroidales bacterium]